MRAKDILSKNGGEGINELSTTPTFLASVGCSTGRPSLRLTVMAITQFDGDTFESTDVYEKLDYHDSTIRENLNLLEENGLLVGKRRFGKATIWIIDDDLKQ